ncbi:MAG: type II toxin-antitoxin system VapC family toxin [Thermomicrobia bacterium]|nr:type II toxin-antitoxin system VapC family toxin [Thermomicrobia bacterium]
MTDFVLDTSVTMAWCFPDEETPGTRDLFTRMRTTAAMVPIIWPLEVANVLLIGERRRRLMPAQVTQFVQLLQTLAITVDTGVAMGALNSVIALGRRYGLSAYDAAYLELAMRQGLPLATQDARLRAAATHAGVPLLA